MNQNVKFVRGQKTLTLPKNSVWSALPIPAYKYLAAIRDNFAKDVLICLMSFLGLGKSSSVVTPSIATLSRMTGRNEASVRKGLNTLIALGYIHKETKRAGRFQNNEYTILPKCYLFTPEMRGAISAMTKEIRLETYQQKSRRLVRPGINPPQIPTK